MSFYEVQPLGWVRGGRTVPLDDDWGPVRSRIEFDPGALDVMATAGLDELSHVEVCISSTVSMPPKCAEGLGTLGAGRTGLWWAFWRNGRKTDRIDPAAADVAKA
jgi:hypothetical protein